MDYNGLNRWFSAFGSQNKPILTFQISMNVISPLNFLMVFFKYFKYLFVAQSGKIIRYFTKENEGLI